MSETKYYKDIEKLYGSLHALDEEYSAKRKKIKTKLAEKIEEARFEKDISVKNIADHLDVKRQTVNKILTDVFGIRHPDKARAAALGHANRG